MMQSRGILVSFVIPVYKVEDVIGQCLASLYAPGVDETKYELIFVNDGTPDASMLPVQELASRHGNVTILEQENAGVSAARNNGLAHARGRYVTFLDSDDRIDPGVLGAVLEELEANPGTDILHLGIQTEDGSARYPFGTLFKDGIIYHQEDLKNYLRCTSCANFYRVSAIRDAGIRFNESLSNAEDSIFYAECVTTFDYFRFMDKTFYYVREREGSASRQYTANIVEKELAAADCACRLKAEAVSPFRRKVFNKLLYSLICGAASLAVKAGLDFMQFGAYGIKRYLPIGYDDLGSAATRFKAAVLNSSPRLFFTIIRIQEKAG